VIALAVLDMGANIVLTVDDDGPGISAADRDRVFDRFVRLDDARARDGGGSGLGLSIVRAVVVLRDGDLVLDQPMTETSDEVQARLPAAPS